MAPKNTFTLGRQEGHTEVGRAPDVVHSAMALLIESQTRPLSLGRFLLSSTGFHLILAWAVIVIVISIVASLLPAMNAVRLTVTQVLAYE